MTAAGTDHKSHEKFGTLLLPAGRVYLLCSCGTIWRIQVGIQEVDLVVDEELVALIRFAFDAVTKRLASAHEVEEGLLRIQEGLRRL
jgi:hypothetical protein